MTDSLTMPTSPPMTGTQASLYQQLRGHLATLKLTAVAEHLPGVLAQAEAEQWSMTATLEHLLAREVEATEARKLAGRLRFASLPTPATLADFDFDAAPSVDKKLVDELTVEEESAMSQLGRAADGPLRISYKCTKCGRHGSSVVQHIYPHPDPAKCAREGWDGLVLGRVITCFGCGTEDDYELDAATRQLLMTGAARVMSGKSEPHRILPLEIELKSGKTGRRAGEILDDHLTYANEHPDDADAWRDYARLHGFGDPPDFVGGNYLTLLGRMSAQDLATVEAAGAGIAAVARGEVNQFQLPQPFHASAGERWFSLKVTPVRDAQERIVVSHEDVTALKAAELASLTLANTDALTGALSRRNFLTLAEQELARASRYQLPLMVLMLDLDHFKRINDHYGHAAGDAVLQSFVSTVAAVLRESDLIGRLGGEEFAVLLPSTSAEGGAALAQRIIDSVRASPVELAGEQIEFTVSIGGGCLGAETSFAALLNVADAALYQAKHAGRDRLELAVALPPAEPS